MLIKDEWFIDKCDEIKPKIDKLQSDNPLGSIIFPAYNEENYLLPTLEALGGIKTKIPIEIIAVNNCSKDRTNDILLSSGVKVVNEGRKGLSYARSAGLEAAKSDIIIQTDADSIVPPSWVDSHFSYYDDPEVGGVNGSIKMYGAHRLYTFYKLGVISFHCLMYLIGVEHNASGGANISYRKSDVMTFGGFELGSDLSEDHLLFNKLSKIKLLKSAKGSNITVLSSGRRYDTVSKICGEILQRFTLIKGKIKSDNGIESGKTFGDIR